MNLHDGLAILKSRSRSPYSHGILRLGLLGLLSALLFLLPGMSRDLSSLVFISGLAPVETLPPLVSLSDKAPSRMSLTVPLRELSANRFVSSLTRTPLLPLVRPMVRGLDASFVEAAVPASDYPDLFCLHADSGSGPVLECHHDDSPMSPPGASPPFLGSDFPTLELRIAPRAVPDAPSSEISPADLASPTPPPRAPFV